MKGIIAIVLSHKDKEAYMIEDAAGYGKGKREIFFFFSKQHYVAGLSL